jgi:hypothetical protein
MLSFSISYGDIKFLYIVNITESGDRGGESWPKKVPFEEDFIKFL